MSLLTTAAAALVGAAIFERFGVPAGAVLGALVGVVLLNTLGSLGPAAELPRVAEFLAFATLGWLVGQGVDRGTLTLVGRSIVPVAAVVVALLLFGLALGWLLVRFEVMDPATSYLATSPGALSQMAAVAAAIDANAALVTTVHTVRVVVLLLLAPLIGRLAGG